MAADETEEMADLRAEAEMGDVVPLKVGDFVTIRGSKKGYLSAEGILDESVCLRRDPTKYDDCIFQVTSMRQSPTCREHISRAP